MVIPIEKDKKRVGRIGKYEEWLTDDGLLRVQGWARDGLTDEQIAVNIGVTPQTIYEWERRFPSFLEALKKGKAPVDLEVENALLKRALGYEYEETVTEIYKGSDGIERSHIRKMKKHMPGDTTAMIYWMNNRRPDRWRNRKAVDETPNEKEKNAPIYELLKKLDGECNV